MQSFLVALCMAILEKLLTKGSQEYAAYEALKSELELSDEKAKKRDAIINDPKSSLEDKLRANDEFGA